MTHSGRRAHIVPVVVDEEGARGVVGISSTLGRIDLKEAFATVQRDGRVDEEGRVSIRNRCVLPMLEKLDSWTPTEAARCPQLAGVSPEPRSRFASDQSPREAGR